jgi:ubiquinone/menaquinone biosynthesis C-methylase UbiE
MKTRGEKTYIKIPSFAARLYDHLTNIRGINQGFEEIALFLDDQIKQGNLLDIGTGPGRLLKAIHEKNPDLNLFGLDISSSMMDLARHNLRSIKNLDLRIGNIVKTDYSSNFFDGIVSTGSFYNWDQPVEGLNEIFRILKPGNIAYIFETTRDYDKKLFRTGLKDNLMEYNPLRRWLSTFFLKKQLRMTYSTQEFEEILKQTEFGKSYKIERITLGNLPIYVRLKLKKN